MNNLGIKHRMKNRGLFYWFSEKGLTLIELGILVSLITVLSMTFNPGFITYYFNVVLDSISINQDVQYVNTYLTSLTQKQLQINTLSDHSVSFNQGDDHYHLFLSSTDTKSGLRTLKLRKNQGPATEFLTRIAPDLDPDTPYFTFSQQDLSPTSASANVRLMALSFTLSHQVISRNFTLTYPLFSPEELHLQ
ncbi:MAG: hypothetical protein CL521_05690 [Actinobacteria bacterium]|nr:hypothetical protein [Actinomycetota bacterium]